MLRVWHYAPNYNIYEFITCYKGTLHQTKSYCIDIRIPHCLSTYLILSPQSENYYLLPWFRHEKVINFFSFYLQTFRTRVDNATTEVIRFSPFLLLRYLRIEFKNITEDLCINITLVGNKSRGNLSYVNVSCSNIMSEVNHLLIRYVVRDQM